MFSSATTIAYDPLSLSPTQIDAGKRLTYAFDTTPGVRWVILQAQMQSGKTETYLFDACERLRLRLVENVVIFSGNAETDLKEQLKKEVLGLGDAKFYGKYEIYLEEIVGLSTRERRPILDLIKTNIQVFWGTELKNYSGPTSNTLFIWEESHHAQSVNNCPAKFLRSVGISANGDNAILSENNNFVVSISATPFSELSDKHHLKQAKLVVIMTPGVNYVSVKEIRDSGRLKGYSNMQEGLQLALATPHDSPMYAIIRISVKNEDIVKSVISRCGWNYVVFDSLAKGEEKTIGENAWNNMARKPEQDTVILIRGKCRMGKNLQKSHVLFVFETAKNSNTDTVLQGLLGRVCGYADGSERIDVWLNSKIINSREIDRYIDMTDGVEVIPRKAMNLEKTTAVKSMHPIIPIHIPDVCNADSSRKQIISVIRNRISSSNVFPGKTEMSQFEEILARFLNTKTEIVCHDVCGNEKNRFQKVSETINRYNNSDDVFPEDLWFTGVDVPKKGLEEGRIINVFCYKTDDIDNDIRAGSVYIYGVTKAKSDVYEKKTNMPATTKREIFAYGLEDGTDAVGNGSFSVNLSIETAHSVEAMKDDIDFIIDLSLKRPNSNKKIVSNWDEKSKEFKGIVVNKAVLAAISPNGVIWKEMKEKYGVELALVKSRGAIPKVIKDAGLTKLAAISW